MTLDQIINITISQSAPTVSLPGFGVTLIASVFASWLQGNAGDLIRYYSTLDGVKLDFSTSAPEYLAAQAAFSAKPRPSQVAIGKIPSLVAGVTNFALSVALITGNVTAMTVNGVTLAPVTYATSSAATMTALATAVAAADGVASCAVDGTNPQQLNVTGTQGTQLTVSGTVTGGASQPTTTTTIATPAVTFSSGLAPIRQADSGWYGLTVLNRTDAVILDVAAWAEANFVKYCACTASSGALTSATTDIASRLKAKSYGNTMIIYHSLTTEYPDVEWLAEMLAYAPGSATAKFKTLPGITPDNLNDTQLVNLQGKNCNVYVTVGGVNITADGKMAGGQWFDTQVGLDWFKAALQAKVFGVLVTLPKLDYTDPGAQLLESALRSQVGEGITAHVIDGTSPQTYNVPRVADQSPTDRQARKFPNIGFNCRLAGAIHSTSFNLVMLP